MQKELITDISIIKEKIFIVRGRKVMLDRDLAELYGVETKVLNQAVRRNIERFPKDFMFQMTLEESGDSLRSQFVTSNRALNKEVEFKKVGRRGGQRYKSFAFTEQGIAMLSSVLNSDQAIRVNIQIIRVFTKLREMIDAYKELREKVEEMEKNNETNFKEIFRVIRLLIKQDETPKGRIGFDTNL